MPGHRGRLAEEGDMIKAGEDRMDQSGRWARGVLAGASVAVLLAFGGPAAGAAEQVPGAGTAEQVPMAAAEIKLTFAPVVRAVAPAVVNIFSQRVITESQVPPMFADPLFRRFLEERGMLGKPRERVQRSLGSGVILRSEGVVVTNAHVVNGASEITVALNDRREFPAELVGLDPRADLAVLRIKSDTPLPSLALADGEPPEVGDLVLAIGNPFGVGQTVTSGIVSAQARTTAGISDYRFFIQTDAAINPGNSGGALVDLSGRLVGINTAIYSRDGGSVGIGFAIPVEMVRSVVEGILEDGKVRHPWLGADGQSVTTELASHMGLDRPLGVAITDVAKGGPAAKAGLAEGDVILALDGRPVFEGETLRYRIATHRPGDKVVLGIRRDGKDTTLAVTLEAPPEDPPRDTTLLKGSHPFDGAEVSNMNPALAEELGLEKASRGVTVTGLGDGVAARIGIRPGDRVIEVNGKAIDAVRDLKAAISKPSRVWQVVVDRDGRAVRLVLGG